MCHRSHDRETPPRSPILTAIRWLCRRTRATGSAARPTARSMVGTPLRSKQPIARRGASPTRSAGPLAVGLLRNDQDRFFLLDNHYRLSGAISSSHSPGLPSALGSKTARLIGTHRWDNGRSLESPNQHSQRFALGRSSFINHEAVSRGLKDPVVAVWLWSGGPRRRALWPGRTPST